jgi:hypothetical protein
MFDMQCWHVKLVNLTTEVNYNHKIIAQLVSGLTSIIINLSFGKGSKNNRLPQHIHSILFISHLHKSFILLVRL